MRRTILAGMAVGLLVAGVPTAVQAASPDPQPFNRTSAFTFEDFCGSGQSIEGAAEVRGVEFLSPNGGLDWVRIASITSTWTNPVTGAFLIHHSAGRWAETKVSGDAEGLHTIEVTFSGSAGKERLPGGGVLSLDAGRMVFRDTYNGDEFVSGEFIILRGQHPVEEDSDAVCQVWMEALDLA